MQLSCDTTSATLADLETSRDVLTLEIIERKKRAAKVTSLSFTMDGSGRKTGFLLEADVPCGILSVYANFHRDRRLSNSTVVINNKPSIHPAPAVLMSDTEQKIAEALYDWVIQTFQPAELKRLNSSF